MAKRANLWVLAYRAPDVNEWIAHCLDLDIVSQGRDLQHALTMVQEAVLMAMRDDLQHGRDPLARNSAPQEDWSLLHRVQKHGARMHVAEAKEGTLAVQFEVVYTTPSKRPDAQAVSPAWLIHAMNNADNGLCSRA